jgi:hypothetical protein
LVLDDGIDFLGLRLLTPLRPICFSFFEFIELDSVDMLRS